MLLLRRFLVLAALFFWQGGFTFYAAVVVPIGQQVLRSHLRQGFITRQVTYYLNLSGAVALVPLAWDLLAYDPRPWRRRLRAGLFFAMFLTLVWLYFLRQRLDAQLVRQGYLILDEESFRPNHRLYLWVSTFQWGCSLAYLALTLHSWRNADQTSRAEVMKV